MSVPPSDGPASVGRRRIVMLPERALTPLALIAREGEERDALEAQLERTRPVVTFPSLAHFCTDSARKERWAGIVLARTHAWDSQLDSFVARRAFIALYALEDEGYGWPEAVRRVAGPEELDKWLQVVTSPVLPDDDKPRQVRTPVRPRKDRGTRISIALAPVRATVSGEGKQLALPISPAGSDTPSESSTPSTLLPNTTPASIAPMASPAVVPKRRGRPPKPKPSVEQLSLEAAAPAAPRERAPSPVRSPSGSRFSGVPSAREEAQLSALALEIGFARSTELLSLIREKAHRLSRWPAE